MTLRSFNLAIDEFLDDDVPQLVTKTQRVLATVGLNGVVLKTPVDTGRAQGAWLVTVNAATNEAPDGGGSAGAQAALAINTGLGVITGAPPFSNIIMQNNVEYIEDLEDGGSRQAPAGMLAVTVAELERLTK